MKRSRAWWWLGAAALGAVAGLAWYLPGATPAGAAAPPFSASASVDGGWLAYPPGPPQGGGAQSQAARAARLRLLQAQLIAADQTLCDYRAASRYPAYSRPIGEHPDQVHPNLPVTEANALRGADGKRDGAVLVQTSQSRVFMVAGEAVAFSLRALDARGEPLALVVTRAVAQGMTFKPTGQQVRRPTAQHPLAFADDGSGADAQAGDGAFAAVLAPSQTGLASFDGTIRTEVRYSVAGRAGVVLFDVIYSPVAPAVWTGAIREAGEGGSLVFILNAQVREAGRYIVSGRIDDATGAPFALATFNEVLGTGPNEVRLAVFGKLLHDRAPAMPLTLRDVEGYLLREDTDPDRALMPRLEGRAFTGKQHALKDFSDQEWRGEERIRHLDEFGKDVARAKAALAGLDPALAPPPSACAPVATAGEGKIAP